MTRQGAWLDAAWWAGRALGGLAAGISSLLWVFAMWMPTTQAVFSGWSFAIGFLMMLFSLLAVIAAIKGHGAMMLAMFLASFLPVGAYLIRVNHWLQWIGVLNLALLVAALMTLWAGGRRRSA